MKAYLVAVVPEEDEVPLVVESDDASTLELGVVGEERCEHSADGLAESSVEII